MDRGSNPGAADVGAFITYSQPQYVNNFTGSGDCLRWPNYPALDDVSVPNPNPNPPNQTALLNYVGGQNLPSSAGGSVRGQETCCLLEDGKRCHRTSGNGRFKKRSKKTVSSMQLRLGIDNVAKHIYICDHHRMVIKDARRTEQNRRDSEDVAVVDAPTAPGPAAPGPADSGPAGPQVDLFQLPMNTLRRYKRHCKIPTRAGVTKVQLADILQEHFKCIPVSEKEDLTYFIYKVKSDRKKLEAKRQEALGSAMDVL